MQEAKRPGTSPEQSIVPLTASPDNVLIEDYLRRVMSSDIDTNSDFPRRISHIKDGSRLELLSTSEGLSHIFIHKDYNPLSLRLWHELVAQDVPIAPIVSRYDRLRSDEDHRHVISRFSGCSLSYWEMYRRGEDRLLIPEKVTHLEYSWEKIFATVGNDISLQQLQKNFKYPEIKDYILSRYSDNRDVMKRLLTMELTWQRQNMKEAFTKKGYDHGHLRANNITLEFIDQGYLDEMSEIGHNINTIPFDPNHIVFDPQHFYDQPHRWIPIARAIDFDRFQFLYQKKNKSSLSYLYAMSEADILEQAEWIFRLPLEQWNSEVIEFLSQSSDEVIQAAIQSLRYDPNSTTVNAANNVLLSALERNQSYLFRDVLDILNTQRTTEIPRKIDFGQYESLFWKLLLQNSEAYANYDSAALQSFLFALHHLDRGLDSGLPLDEKLIEQLQNISLDPEVENEYKRLADTLLYYGFGKEYAVLKR